MANWSSLQEEYLSALVEHFEQWSERYTDLRLTSDIRVATWRGKGIQRSADKGQWLFREALGAQDEGGRLLRERVVIVGEPGAGKSTACQRATWELAREGLAALGSPLRVVVPVYFELGAFYRNDTARLRNLAPQQRMLRLLANQMRARLSGGKRFDWSQLSKAMESSRFVFFLDGLNEVPEGLREGLLEDLSALMGAFAGRGHQVVITTRKFDYEQVFAPYFATKQVALLELLALDGAGVSELVMRDLGQIGQAYGVLAQLRKGEQARAKVALDALKGGDGAYLADVERLLGLDGALMASLQQAHKLLTLLREPDYERVWWLAQNPGMLSDMIRVYQGENELPRSRSRLLQKAIEARLLAEGAKRRADSARFPKEIKFEVLAQVAFEMMAADQGLSMAQRDILNLFTGHVRQEETQPLLQELTFRDGLLVQKAAERYGFIRQPYQELFAARQLWQQWQAIRDNGQDPLQERSMQAFWQPRYWAVTAMMVGLLPQKEAKPTRHGCM